MSTRAVNSIRSFGRGREQVRIIIISDARINFLKMSLDKIKMQMSKLTDRQCHISMVASVARLKWGISLMSLLN